MGVPVAVPSPETCLAFFLRRKDLSLGILPQLLLDAEDAERWGYFWFAARCADDDIEQRFATADDYARRLHRPDPASPADAALQHFLSTLPPHMARDAVVQDLEVALQGLGQERAWASPPSLADYAAAIKAKSATALILLNRLLLPSEPEQYVRRFATLLAFSIQLGDDLRDRPRDAAAGLQTLTSEELALAGATDLGDADEAPQSIQKWREDASLRLALLALEAAEKVSRQSRPKARMQAHLWLGAIATGQLAPSDEPVRWPHPIGSLAAEDLPSLAHLANIRETLHAQPLIVGDTARWDPPHRAELLRQTKERLPQPYLLLEAFARL